MVEFRDRIKLGGKTFALIRVKDAKISKYNVRKEPDKLEREVIKETLAKSIKELGLQQMPVCTSEGEIFVGGRRYIAYDELQEEWMAVEVRDLLPVDQMMASWTENFHRKEPDYWNEGRLFKKMITLGGVSIRSLAERLGVSEPYVRHRIKIHEKISDAFASRAITYETARYIATSELPQEAEQKLFDKAISERLEAPEVKKLISNGKAVSTLLEGTTEEIAKEFTDKLGEKLYLEELDIGRIHHDITVAEGNQPALKTIEIEGDVFKSEQEADTYFKKYGGCFVAKVILWVGKVDPYLYEKEREQEGKKDAGSIGSESNGSSPK